MKKTSIPVSNRFCPQALFVYGTYKQDKTPNFGLFCWMSYCWDKELQVMACIGGEKLTKDRIRAEGVFSANLVTRPLLPLADYLGNTEGYAEGKMDIPLQVEKGAVLNVPVLADSPWTFELEVRRTIPMDDGDVFICRIANVLAADELLVPGRSPEALMADISPVVTAGVQRYFALDPACLGAWGDWRSLRK